MLVSGVDRISQLINTLEEMQKICEVSNLYIRTGYFQDHAAQSVTSRSVVVAYTDVEERWLKKHLDSFEVRPFTTCYLSLVILSSLRNHSRIVEKMKLLLYS